MDEAASGTTTLPFPLPQGPPVDWAELPADLVAAICKRLHDLFDFVFFRAVCKNWRAATFIAALPPPQFPWVLERRQDPDRLHVYSLITGKTRAIRCPKARGRGSFLQGLSHGYLYYCETGSGSDHWNHFLWNPLTNDEVHIEPEMNIFGCMVCMDPYPMGKNSYIAFRTVSHGEEMGFYQPRSKKWYYVQLPVVRFNWRSACLNGSCYIIDGATRNTVIVDIAKGSSFSVPPPDNRDVSSVKLVESAGKILCVARREGLCTDPSNFNFSFDIYQLDVLDKNCGYRWVKISSIGNQILFWDVDGGISIAACETTGLRGNCIYYLASRSDELFRYTIEDGKVGKICSHLGGLSNWFVPHIAGSLSMGSC